MRRNEGANGQISRHAHIIAPGRGAGAGRAHLEPNVRGGKGVQTLQYIYIYIYIYIYSAGRRTGAGHVHLGPGVLGDVEVLEARQVRLRSGQEECII